MVCIATKGEPVTWRQPADSAETVVADPTPGVLCEKKNWHMVYVHVYGLECGSTGDAVILRAELVYKGGAGSKCEDVARDWKPDAKLAAAAKLAVGGTKMWKSAFKFTLPASVAEEGGPGSPAKFLQRHTTALGVLEKHGISGSLKSSWASDASSNAAWAGVKIKADPSGLALKKLLAELRSACE